MQFDEEEIRDYLKGGLSEDQRLVFDQLVKTDSLFAEKVVDIANLIEISRKAMRLKLKEELNCLDTIETNSSNFSNHLNIKSIIYISIGIILIIIVTCIFFYFNQGDQIIQKKQTKIDKLIQTEQIDREKGVESENIKKSKKINPSSIKKDLFNELTKISTVDIQSIDSNGELITFGQVEVFFIQTTNEVPEYQFEKTDGTQNYRLIVKAKFSEELVQEATIIDLQDSNTPYKHIKIGKEYYKLKPTNGKFQKLEIEENKQVKKELRSFWKKIGHFIKNLFKKK